MVYAPPCIPGWMLEKGGGFVVAIFPKGWVLSQDIPIKSNCIHILCVKWILCKFHKYPYLPITHYASLTSQTQPTPVRITFSITHVILKSICTGVCDTKAIHAGVGWVWLARLTLCMTRRYGICRMTVRRIVPKSWGVTPLCQFPS